MHKYLSICRCVGLSGDFNTAATATTLLELDECNVLISYTISHINSGNFEEIYEPKGAENLHEFHIDRMLISYRSVTGKQMRRRWFVPEVNSFQI